MSKVILGKVARKTKPNRTVRPPTEATPGELASESRTYDYNAGSGTLTHTWPIPTQVVAGDHIYVAIMMGEISGIVPTVSDKPAGYTTLLNATDGGSDKRYHVFWKEADGTETDGTFTVGNDTRVALVSWRLAGSGAGSLGTPEIAGPDTLNDPDPITTSTAGYHAVFVVHMPNGGEPDPDLAGAAPTNYESVNFAQSEAALNRAKVYVAQRAVVIATSEDPGSIGWSDPGTGSFRFFRNWTVATRLDTGPGELATGDHTHTEADVTDLDHWTEADHDALDHTGLTGVGTDADAIHDNVSGEIAAVTEKVSPVSADLLLIEDSAASNAKKRLQIGNLPGGAFGDLTDVDLTGLDTGQAAFYNGTSWENARAPEPLTDESGNILTLEDDSVAMSEPFFD